MSNDALHPGIVAGDRMDRLCRVVFLASDDSRNMTGESVTVGGGDV